MLKIQHILRLATLLLLFAYPVTGHTSETSSPRTLTITINSPRPLPPDLVPLIYNGNLGGEIRRFTVIEMKSSTPSTFTAEVPWNQPTIALAIDHPGYLRGFSTQISLVEVTSHTINLPAPGSLHATLELQYIRSGNRPHYADAEEHCITSSLTTQSPDFYQINNPLLPVPDWQLTYNDLAPGTYEIFATGRDCQKPEYAEGHGSHGPAGSAGKSRFSVTSGHLTKLGFPIFTRPDFEKSETTSPTISITPLSTSPQN